MKRRGFTLVEMLVVVTIILLLAGLLQGALVLARGTAREIATKATIAKLNNIILRQYESYVTRRVSLDASGMSPQQANMAIRAAKATPLLAAQFRLDTIRDIMRMEMPDARSDVTRGPVAFSWGSVLAPALHRLYATSPPTGDHDAAQCLYMIVSIGNPEAMEQFHQSEIGMVDGRPCFVDGWDRPIMFLRWAPGYSSCTDPDFIAATGIIYTGASQIQSGVIESYPRLNPDGTPKMIQKVDAQGNPMFNPDGTPAMLPVIVPGDHDPFDTRRVDGFAFHMIPLVYSAGPDGVYDLNTVAGYVFTGDPYAEMRLGEPIGSSHFDNIDNHKIEQR